VKATQMYSKRSQYTTGMGGGNSKNQLWTC